MPKKTSLIIPNERIQQCIYIIRQQKVMLDKDLADLYGVKPIALRQQVKRNIERFPSDFMYQLTDKEVTVLLSQNVIASRKSLGGHNLMLSPSRVWRCFRAFCGASVRLRSISLLCGHLSNCGKFWLPTLFCVAKSNRWNGNTMKNFSRFLLF
ncbi:MAG: ORF6N domain-containing protein [Sedimentisphaerales bacterium]|nr:ORF6N domain-containing protein [Sedimentisphaerales bacterium]